MDKIIFTKSQNSSTAGFTLIEVMIALFISIFIFMALYSVYVSQNKAYISQQSVAEMQQNSRAAINVLGRDLRMAGFDPTGSGNFGFVDNTAPTWTGGVTRATNATQVSFTADLDGNGAVDIGSQDRNGDGSIDMSDIETISYRLNGTNLQRHSNTNGAITWQTIAENVQDLAFRYLDSGGNVTSDLEKIKTVNMSLLFFSEETGEATLNQSFTNANAVVINTNDRLRRRMVTSAFYCRNMGL